LFDKAGCLLASHTLALAATLLLCAGCAGPAAPSTPLPQSGCDISAQTRELAAEFRRLRAVQGHWQGGPANPEVDAWNGRKHQVMIELGSALGGGECGREQAIELLGPPDLIAGRGDTEFDVVSRQYDFQAPTVADYKLLIYQWRGTHDYLYFVVDDQTVFGSGWWYAYE
jgi:hypothetical protein